MSFMQAKEDDPNYKAYQEANDHGDFKDLQSGTFVAFCNGIFLGSAVTHNALETLIEEKVSGGKVFLQQVNQTEHTYRKRGVRVVKKRT
jgi:hypothetical protein